jgi:hypothetical protein
MTPPRLHVPDEPAPHLSAWRRRLDDGEALTEVLHGHDGVGAWYWARWQAVERLGCDREGFDGVVAGFERELGLWLRGERTHRAVASSLAGRVTRRLRDPAELAARATDSPPSRAAAPERAPCLEERLVPTLSRCA